MNLSEIVHLTRHDIGASGSVPHQQFDLRQLTGEDSDFVSKLSTAIPFFSTVTRYMPVF